MDVRVTVLYDRWAEVEGLGTGWGFSALVETVEPPGKILFDTGWDGKVLLENMNALGISPGDVDLVMLSHNHWDHAGGLPVIIRRLREDVRVLLSTSFSRRNMDEIRRFRGAEMVEHPGRIEPWGVYTTGSLESDAGGEQSLVVPLPGRGENLVVVGCSHPGVIRIVETAKKFGPVYGVLGGMHSFREFEKLKDLKFFAPLHCTRYREVAERLYPDRVFVKGVGGIYRF